MRNGHTPRLARRQRGATLLVGLIILVLTTLLVLTSFLLGRTNFDIVANSQHRHEALGSAQQAIEAAISSPLLTTNPASVFPVPCNGPNTQCYDVNGDGTDDVTVTLTPNPACVKAQTIKNSSLDLMLEDDRRCTIQDMGDPGIENANAGNSLCSNSVWDIRAEAKDATTNTTAVVNQGIAVRVRTVDVASACP